jgi:hypothetical protein
MQRATEDIDLFTRTGAYQARENPIERRGTMIDCETQAIKIAVKIIATGSPIDR